MLSRLKNLLVYSNGDTRWDPPAHFIHHRGPRSSIDLEREAAERRRRAMKSVGMW